MSKNSCGTSSGASSTAPVKGLARFLGARIVGSVGCNIACYLMLAAIAAIAFGQTTAAQDIKKSKQSYGLDLSKFDVPEVPADALPTGQESSKADAIKTGKTDDSTEAIVEDSVASPKLGLPKSNPNLGGFPPLASVRNDEPMSLQGEYELSADGKRGTLKLTATLEGNWHTYSTTQMPGGPKRSVIKIESPEIKLSGPFSSEPGPELSQSDDYPGISIEEHKHRVVWTAPFEVLQALQAGQELKVKFDGQVCDDVCREVRTTISARPVAPSVTARPVAAFRAPSTHAEISMHIEPAELKPGTQATLVINAKPDPTFHLYQYVPKDTETQFRTLIVPTNKGGLKWGQPTTATAVHSKNDSGVEYSYYDGDVTWRVPLQVPADLALGTQAIELAMGYFTCNDSQCDPPAGLLASAQIAVVASPGSANMQSLEIKNSKFKVAASQSNLGDWIDFQTAAGSETAPEAKPQLSADATGGLAVGRLSLMTLLFALGGGFILNFMPCVLPVIGLKVLGFVEQAGSSRSEVIKLNVAYILGICVVMWTLAGITVATQNTFGWGQQFTKFEFKLAMAALVFAMALSFLGVWEIPIPGFATSYKSNQMMQREGTFGAFSKGLITTILATPCSGPLLGFVFVVAVTLDPFGVFAVYTMVGLGMGLPFIVLCLRPSAVKMLPKPGVWMETLKEGLAFPLLLTVVYFVAAIGPDYRIATFSTLIAVWFACWLIGKVPIYADFNVKARTWASAIAVAVVWGMISFSLLGPHKTDMPWEPYSPERLAQLQREGKTVMIDFTANWCANCQTNSRLSIDVPGVIDIVKKNGVVPLLADKTEESPAIDDKLMELQGTTVIPFLAIYPGKENAKPILIPGTFGKNRLIDALSEAGPSTQNKSSTLTATRSANKPVVNRQ